MNLNTIAVSPHAEGFIKVAAEDDPLFGEARTKMEFLVTARHHERPEEPTRLAAHPIAAKLASGEEGGEQKITEIPIRLFFNKAANALSIRYQAYETPGNKPVCSGDGKDAQRLTRAADHTPTYTQVACPGPELCDLVATGAAVCRRQVRMPVQIEGQTNPLSVFEVRTSSLNTYRALRAQLQLIERQFGGLRHVPLKLTLWQASNELSGYEPFSLMQLQLDAPSLPEALGKAKEAREALKSAGVDDDVDAILCAGDAESPFTAAVADFDAVSEFYRAESPRRAGTEPINSPLRAQSSAAAGRGLAAAAIAEAVSRGSVTFSPIP